jgi:hypothetical protein
MQYILHNDRVDDFRFDQPVQRVAIADLSKQAAKKSRIIMLNQKEG